MTPDPSSPSAASWLTSEPSPQTHLAVVGFPLNRSLSPARCDLAPAAVRKALTKFSVFDCDNQVDLRLINSIDLGDVAELGATPEAEVQTTVEFFRRQQTATGVRVLLGGDNGIARLGVHSFGLPLNRVGLITFAPHHGVRELAGGLNNSNSVRALIRDGLRGTNIVQIGIQPFANLPEEALFARDSGLIIETAEEVFARGIEAIVARSLTRLASADAIYISFDLSVLDRSLAPACSGARPGGLSPWMLRKAARMCGAAPKVRALDLVEIDPTRDRDDVTAQSAATFLLAFASGVAARLKAF